MGIAIAQGYLGINNTISSYLGCWINHHPKSAMCETNRRVNLCSTWNVSITNEHQEFVHQPLSNGYFMPVAPLRCV
ncbi:hypothetical protein [Bacteroides ovatus]|uniref:hypothetical protein n=1 Tax=Bacteroides ovatus TaxID=28116 RepID=UPI0018CBDA07|nr:hypothetical protein [Bacteroides ovatus]MBG9220334.1 hypothetical protein [Bacteroides ovatus]MBG9233468.1 hypothetical protein [Bacteroides ovatus]